MIALNSILILLTAFIAVFLQCSTNLTQRVFGTQFDLLPPLMVYAGLTGGPWTVAALALCGGLWFDSLSANTPGLTVLSLLLVGQLITLRRELILRQQSYAQIALGLAAGAAVPLLSLLLLWSAGKSPVVGWGTVWQVLVLTAVSGVATPVLFKLLGFLIHNFGYRDPASPGFRPDREIRRGRI